MASERSCIGCDYPNYCDGEHCPLDEDERWAERSEQEPDFEAEQYACCRGCSYDGDCEPGIWCPYMPITDAGWSL